MAVNIYDVSPDGTRIAEDILAKDGGVIKRRGQLSLKQNVENGFNMFRQHVNGQGGIRPALSIGSYPRGLLIGGMGAEVGGYGSQNDGGGAYINLDRSREGVWVTNSFVFGLFAQSQADAVGVIHVYCDTQAWDDARRSFYDVKIDLAAKTIALMGSDGQYHTVDSAARVPGFNQNKFDATYCSFTYWLGPTGAATETDFGAYGAFQLGGKVYDLRQSLSFGAKSAKVTPQAVAGVSGGAVGSTLMESFAGGRNPGFSVTTPVAGKYGGIVLYRWEETIGDILV